MINCSNNIFPAGMKIESVAASIEEMAEQSAFWALESKQLGRGLYAGKISAVHSAGIQLARWRRSLGELVCGQVPRGTVVLFLPIRATSPIHYCGELFEDVTIGAQRHGEEIDVRFAGALEGWTVAVDENRLQACAMALWGEEFDARRHRQRLLLNDAAARRRMAARLGVLLDDARRDGAQLANRAIAKGFEAAVLEAIFENVSGREWLGSAPARYRQAQEAADFLHAHCREEVSVADLCVAAGTSRRTLHLGFYEVFGTSPIEYLTALRLNGVRSELKKSRDGAGEDAGVVTRAAMSWGFTHLGHFSARYRAQFGESPSETMRR